MKVDIRSSAGLPTAYLDIVRNGQTLLTRWFNVKDGAVSDKVNLPPLTREKHQSITCGTLRPPLFGFGYERQLNQPPQRL